MPGSADLLRDAIRPLGQRDLPAMAEIHASSGTPGLLSDLGQPFLRDVYYAGVLSSSRGRARGIDVRGSLAGFVSFSGHSDRMFRDIILERPAAFAAGVAKAALRRPIVAARVLETGLRMRSPGAGATVEAEIVSLEVARAYQGLGLGYFLLERAVTELQRPIKARILVGHRAVEQLYERLGFRAEARFTMHGRRWSLLILR